MKQVYILRHAKSSWDNKDLADFDRPLSNRGEKDAQKLCAFAEMNGIVIDKVMCSNAKRTKETFDLVADGFNFPIADAFYTEDLYFGDVNNIVSSLRKLDEKLKNILIVGHNPTLHMLVEILTEDSIEKFSTCNLAIINFKGEWKTLDFHKSSLKSLIRPKEIKA